MLTVSWNKHLNAFGFRSHTCAHLTSYKSGVPKRILDDNNLKDYDVHENDYDGYENEYGNDYGYHAKENHDDHKNDCATDYESDCDDYENVRDH